MGLIKEPLDVDFYVDPRPLTKKEKEAISKHIREYKEKMAKHTRSKARNEYTITVDTAITCIFGKRNTDEQ